MIDGKADTLLTVAEQKSFTRAAQQLSLTQPAVSHQISQLEQQLQVPLFIRKKGDLLLTAEGKIAVKYAKRFKAMDEKMRREIADAKRNIHQLRVGVTHTSESNFVIEVLTRYSGENPNLNITVVADTIKNLYSMLENFEIDIAIVEGKSTDPEINSLILDTDYLACVVSNNSPLAKRAMVTVEQLKKEKLILRSAGSATRMQFESSLMSMNESIDSFNIIVEVDNVATIKDLIRKDLGVSILARSACMDELRKGKITVLPIENLSMVRDTNILYHNTFSHMDVLQHIARVYQETAKRYLNAAAGEGTAG